MKALFFDREACLESTRMHIKQLTAYSFQPKEGFYLSKCSALSLSVNGIEYLSVSGANPTQVIYSFMYVLSVCFV